MSHIIRRKIIAGVLVLTSLTALGGWIAPAAAGNPRTALLQGGDSLPLTETYTLKSGYSVSYPQGWAIDYEMNEPDISLLQLGSTKVIASQGGFFYNYAPGDVSMSFTWEALGHFSGVDATSTPVDVLDASIIGMYPDMGYAYEIPLGDRTAAIAEGIHSSGKSMMAVFFFWDEGTIAWFLALTAPGEYEQFKPTLLAIAESMVPGVSAIAQEPASPNDLLRLLEMIPDVPQAHTSEIYFGDIAAWYTSWSVLRIPNVTMAGLLPREQHARWMFTLSDQTVPPKVLGVDTLIIEDMRAVYGFDVFQVDHFIYTGAIPDDLAFVEAEFLDENQVAARLGEIGYTSEPSADPWTLYSFGDDYESGFQNAALPIAGRLGSLNRIAVGTNQLVIARATQNITVAVQAAQNIIDSLADNPLYVAGATALLDPALADTGELVGAILTEQNLTADSVALPAADADPLPQYELSVFGTRHSAEQGATFLILGLVFPAGVDAEHAANIIANRITDYTSLVTNTPLTDKWALDRALGADVEGHPVALVVMRIDDPPIGPEDDPADAKMVSWFQLLATRDLGFMMPGPFVD